MTAGSLVLMDLIRGTIFSCIVYLSRTLDDDVVFLLSALKSPSPSFDGSFDPPHSTTND
ncbi:hypothetical protein VDGD_20855 [Verticillium dahliae]|nr:hypothetical protein VDGD_20855 [Verticillium dahliae]